MSSCLQRLPKLPFPPRRPRAVLPIFLALLSSVFPCLAPVAWAEPVPMRGCAGCHPGIYASFMRHGMADSLGTVDKDPVGKVKNAKTGWSYEMVKGKSGSVLHATAPDGGNRTQRVVGRIGAGIFDISYATVEVDAVTGRDVNRLFFAPVETVTGHGLELSPFEYAEIPSAVDMPITADCLTCHTDTAITGLQGAAEAGGSISPGNALGADAFEHLKALTCDACHGDPRRHLSIMAGLEESDDTGIELLASATPARQRDVCARCHLQGDVRFQMVQGRPAADAPLAAQFPTLVTERPGDDFRFVGQLERLALSDCFKGTPEMTCSTCHDPHVGVAEQGIASFEKTCMSCHTGEAGKASCSRNPALQVASITGGAARGEAGCVDCHVRRSPPFDLPHIATIDHNIRRNIPKPKDVPFRSITEPDAGLKIWDDGRLAKTLKTTAGRRWEEGLLAMAAVQTGRFEEAVARFDSFPAPGSVAATRASAPAPLVALETWPTFHHLRGMALLSARRPAEAEKAFSDALRLDPGYPGALIARARMGFLSGNGPLLMNDTQKLIETFPESEGPWQLRATVAARMGRPQLEISGLEESLKRWPSDARAWLRLSQLYAATGRQRDAADAQERVRMLAPSLLAPPSAPSR